MQAGRMDRRITLQTLTETQNDRGEPIKSWATLARVWAQVVPVKGTEDFLQGQKYATAEAQFFIRWRSDIDEKTVRISHDGDIYDIFPPIEIGRRRGLQILAKRVE